MGDRKSFVLCMLISLVCFASAADAAAIPWRVKVKDAVTEATNLGKPLLVSVSTDWCHYCKKMDRETLSDARVAKHIEECFVPLKVDGDKDRELVRMLGVRSFPTMVILSPKMKVLGTMKGFRTADQLNAALESICSAAETPVSAPVGAREVLGRRGNHTLRETSLKPSPFGDHCPVTSFHAKKLVPSSAAFQTPYRGFLVTFATEEARQRFQESPDRYWPLLDGRCVVSALEETTLRPGTWEHGVAFADRIWFLASKEHMNRFAEQPEAYLNRLVQLSQNGQVH